MLHWAYAHLKSALQYSICVPTCYRSQLLATKLRATKSTSKRPRGCCTWDLAHAERGDVRLRIGELVPPHLLPCSNRFISNGEVSIVDGGWLLSGGGGQACQYGRESGKPHYKQDANEKTKRGRLESRITTYNIPWLNKRVVSRNAVCFPEPCRKLEVRATAVVSFCHNLHQKLSREVHNHQLSCRAEYGEFDCQDPEKTTARAKPYPFQYILCQ